MINASLAHLTDFVDGKATAIDPSGRGLDLVAPQTGRPIGRHYSLKAVRFNRWSAHGH
jgi:hypothetical protein